MLGVVYELGLGVAPNRARAKALYRHACEGGNARACANLGEALLADATRDGGASAAVGLLEASCASEVARACTLLGRAHARGIGVARQPRAASVYFERACKHGEGGACLELADLIARGDLPAPPGRGFSLVVEACARGNAEGCARLRAQAPVAANIAGGAAALGPTVSREGHARR
jgi:TPR repeat protein